MEEDAQLTEIGNGAQDALRDCDAQLTDTGVVAFRANDDVME